MDIVNQLKKSGFQRTVYTDQNGSPVFYTKDFAESDIPLFAARFSQDNFEESPEKITLEISEDGTVLQYVAGLDYMDSINPTTEPEAALKLLEEFGLRA